VAQDGRARKAIEAQPSFGQIKPWRGHVARAPNICLGKRRGGTKVQPKRPVPALAANMVSKIAHNSKAPAEKDGAWPRREGNPTFIHFSL
jgi:hypothetical protein